MGKKVEMIGSQYGMLTVISESKRRTSNGGIYYICKCGCGNMKEISGDALRSGATVSCGCYNKIKSKKDNPVRKLPLYSIYRGMKRRCRNSKDKAYKNYGMRGIDIHPAWNSFDAFRKWSEENGYKKGLWLDRIDNDKGYAPDNCRWTTPKEQQNNKRTNIYLTIGGETKTLTEWAEDSGIKPCTLKRRLELGWRTEDLLKAVDKRYSHSLEIKRAINGGVDL